MIFKFLSILSALLICLNTLGQNTIPVIKANSQVVDIRDNNNLKKGAWSIVPEADPDIYTTSSSKVTFYTDVDSISFKVEPDKQYDFVILVNGKDSARTRIVYEPSRLDILKKGKEYDYNDQRTVPKFEYQSQNHPDLIRLRNELHLDSIAGNGSELSKIFNLMHWVHNTVKHDGSSHNPDLKNAVDLIRVCEAENRGLNCRMMATILNECYLAMGIKSRYITCMPKETKFQDCHVINMVYSTELKKWVWMDPTFDAYVMDENGNLLSIREVRERLILDQPVILNADANWNKTQLQNKDYYLEEYMAKNLYRLQTPVVSEFNTETWTNGKAVSYIELLPLDGIEQTPQKKEVSNSHTGSTNTYYKTNNPDLFWATPE